MQDRRRARSRSSTIRCAASSRPRRKALVRSATTVTTFECLRLRALDMSRSTAPAIRSRAIGEEMPLPRRRPGTGGRRASGAVGVARAESGARSPRHDDDRLMPFGPAHATRRHQAPGHSAGFRKRRSARRCSRLPAGLRCRSRSMKPPIEQRQPIDLRSFTTRDALRGSIRLGVDASRRRREADLPHLAGEADSRSSIHRGPGAMESLGFVGAMTVADAALRTLDPP